MEAYAQKYGVVAHMKCNFVHKEFNFVHKKSDAVHKEFNLCIRSLNNYVVNKEITVHKKLVF